RTRCRRSTDMAGGSPRSISSNDRSSAASTAIAVPPTTVPSSPDRARSVLGWELAGRHEDPRHLVEAQILCLGEPPQHVERAAVIQVVALHQDALGLPDELARVNGLRERFLVSG